MKPDIKGKRIAIVATHGFEQSELTEPQRVLREAGATVDVVSTAGGRIQGMKHFEKGEEIDVDVQIGNAVVAQYDAVVIPGGLFNPDKLRVNKLVLEFVKSAVGCGKTVAAICHGPWVLVDAGVAKDRKLTSVGSIRKDLENAGAAWSDAEVVVDRNLITSRTPADLPAFCDAIIKAIGTPKCVEVETATPATAT